TIFGIDNVLPLESVVAGHAGVTPRPANERARDMVTRADELASQLAVNHVAALVGPDATALHACAAVGESDRLCSEPHRGPLRPGEQQRPCQFEYGRTFIRTQAQRPARACCSPRPLERVPFAGAWRLRNGTTRLAARGREQESGEQ